MPNDLTPKDFPPEEKLLRLIKGKRENPFGAADLTAPKKQEKEPAPETTEEKEKEDIAEQKKKPYSNGKRLAQKKQEPPVYDEDKPQGLKNKVSNKPAVSFNANYIYTVLVAASLAVFGFFAFNIYTNKEREDLKNLKLLVATLSKEAGNETAAPGNKAASTKNVPEQSNRPQKNQLSYEEYQKLIDQKNVFTPPSKNRGEGTVSQDGKLRDMIKDLRLVGIVPGNEPQAIIEDKKNGQTLFVKKNEHLENIDIRDISEGKVILGYGDETITLSL